MSAHFRHNVQFAIHERFGTGYKDKQLADVLKVDRSTVNRLRNAEALPRQDKLEALSRYFAVPLAAWELPPDEFISAYSKRSAPPRLEQGSLTRSVSMQTVEKNHHLWRQSHAIHEGQYIIFWKAFGQDGHYVASLLEIQTLGDNGIGFELLNPYIRDDVEQDHVRTWKYVGVMYPIADYLYFFGEQSDGTYELFSMITTASPIAPPDLLRGCLLGIHVMDGKKQIAVNAAVALTFLKKPVSEWREEIGERLGKLPSSKVPQRIKRLIDPYPGVIPLV